MRLKCVQYLGKAILVASLSALTVAAQDVRIELGKHSTRIPKVCESVVPAAIPVAGAGEVDVPALVNEAICKGAGDMLAEYTFVTNLTRREKDKKGKTKEESWTYEVFIPTLKSGTHTKGVLVVTSRNGIPVSPSELEKERAKAAERIEKEEAKIALEKPINPPPLETDSNRVQGMAPLGMYPHSGINVSSLVKRGSVVLAVHTFLKNCDLSFARREQPEGRETLVFNFTPRREAQFNDSEKYIAQLNGEIWIDVQDRIVTRLVGWPVSVTDGNKDARVSSAVPIAGERPPAVYVEMMRLPQPGIWLTRVVRINGADYQKLFDGIITERISTYSNYIRFSTEVTDVKVEPPGKP